MLIIIALFAVFLIGIPISFSLGIVSAVGVLVKGFPANVVIQNMFTGVDTFPLVAVALFILSGNIMIKGGMSKRLIDFADVLVGHLPSGLAMVSILSCMFFAAITGSAIAATAAVGGIMIPIMIDRGYHKEFTAPLLATGGSIGPIIPPSIPLLLYGVMANVSVAKLFIGGFVPGILMGIGLMIYSYFIGKKRNYIGRAEKAPFKLVLSKGKDTILALFMPVIIIGGIMSGVFTATESAAIAVLYALIVSLLIYRELKMDDLFMTLVDTAKATGQVLIVVAFASLFTWLITIELIPQQITRFLASAIDSKIVLLLVINIILLIAGTFIDTTSALVIFAPLFLPLIGRFGIDPIHFGLIMVVNLTIGMCTPPLGVCLFVSGSIAKVSLAEQTRELLPMLAVLIVVLLAVTYIPQLTLFLPNLFG